MFTWPCKTIFTTAPDPLELQILLEDQTATELLFQSYAATTTIDRMTWLACISHYVRGHIHKTGDNYNGKAVQGLGNPRLSSYWKSQLPQGLMGCIWAPRRFLFSIVFFYFPCGGKKTQTRNKMHIQGDVFHFPQNVYCLKTMLCALVKLF